MKIVLGYLLLAFFLNGESHDMRMAIYTVHIEEGQLLCDTKIDREDFKDALGGSTLEHDMNSYLHDHLLFKFDSVDISYRLVSHAYSKNWISVRFELKTSNHTPKDIYIQNTVLSDFEEKHDNLMRFFLHGQKRIFRLNEHRKNVSFNY